MSEAKPTFSTTCPDCGQEIPPAAEACPGCGKANTSAEFEADSWSKWSKDGNSLKTKWVTSVVAFWVSTAVLLLVYIIEKKLNLILVSIVLGMMIIGVWLKTRYQLHQRSEPGRSKKNP